MILNNSYSSYLNPVSFCKKPAHKLNKQREVARMLPKAPWVTQAHLDTLFSQEAFSRRVQDPDWFKYWQETGIPNTGFCYAAAEFWYFFVQPESNPMKIVFDKKIQDPKTGVSRNKTHWFLIKDNDGSVENPAKATYRWRDKVIYDPSRHQYKEEPDYSKGVGNGFMTEFPSRKACEIAVELGIISKEFAEKIPKIFRDKDNKKLNFDQKLAILKKEIIKDKTRAKKISLQHGVFPVTRPKVLSYT